MGLSSREVEGHKFSTSMRGYDKTEVDTFLGEIAKQLSTNEEQLAIATSRAERAKEELDSLNDVLEARLAEAQSAREAILQKAKAEAAQIASTSDGGIETADASRKAAAIVSEAETKASLRMAQVDTAIEQAEADAERITKAADDDAGLKLAEADRVLENARREAREMHKATEAARTELESNVLELRKLVATANAADGDLHDVNIVVRNGEEIIVDLRAPVAEREDVRDPA
ncbi:MAG: DivIVA domain-containing protein [Acidimicrobiia bacterium]